METLETDIAASNGTLLQQSVIKNATTHVAINNFKVNIGILGIITYPRRKYIKIRSVSIETLLD